MLYVNSLNMSPLIIVLANLDFNASFKCYLLNDQAARVDFRYLYRVSIFARTCTCKISV